MKGFPKNAGSLHFLDLKGLLSIHNLYTVSQILSFGHRTEPIALLGEGGE
jgi:hypothetical protein